MEFISSINEINSISADQFILIFSNVIELWKDAAVKIEKKRPFLNLEELYNSFHAYLDQLEKESQLEILKLHPDLAGRIAATGGLTKESAKEQSSAGLDRLTTEQKQYIDVYNERYKDKFGFPFIICARENKVDSIIQGLQIRYKNECDEEIRTAIEEVKKICKLRILDIVSK